MRRPARRPAAVLLAILLASACARTSAPGRVVVLGFDGLEPRAVDILLAEGRLPNFAKLRQSGAYGRLSSREPLLDPVLWTTIATGKTEHGIERLATTDETGEPLPVRSRDRSAKALWNIASEAGRTVGVVGWWATWPAESVRGAIVSDHISYHFMFPQGFTGARDPAGIVYPPELGAEIGPLVRRPSDMTVADLGSVARVEAQDAVRPFDFRDPLEHLKWILASTESHRSIGLHLWEKRRPDLLLVYFEGTDAAAHLFGHLFRQRPRPGDPAPQLQRYAQTLEGVIERADRVVGDFLNAIDDRTTTLVVVSDHGFQLGESADPEAPARRPVGHRFHTPEGLFYLYGNAVRRPASLEGATVLDVAPTVLTLLGLPAAGDMPGRVLTEALALPVPTRVATYGGPAPIPEPTEPQGREDAAAAAWAYQSFVDKSPADPSLRLRLASALRALGRDDEAVAQLDVALSLDPLNAGAYLSRAVLREKRGKTKDAAEDYRNALRCKPGLRPAREALERLTGSDRVSPLRNEAERRASALADEAARLAEKRDYETALAKLDEAVRIAPNLALVHQYRSNVAYMRGDSDAALASLRRALKLEPDNVVLRENLRQLEKAR